jgi:hypothetical protein
MSVIIALWVLAGFSVGRATATRETEVHIIHPDGKVDVRVATHLAEGRKEILLKGEGE